MTTLEAIGLVWLVAINLTGFAVAGSDKKKARQGAWRVPEKRFVLYAALGGGLGVLAGFLTFRHKTRHGKLLAGVIAVTVLFWAAVFTVARFL